MLEKHDINIDILYHRKFYFQFHRPKKRLKDIDVGCSASSTCCVEWFDYISQNLDVFNSRLNVWHMNVRF